MSGSGYSFFSRLMHRMALNPVIAEASFDLQNALHPPKNIEITKPVFITGLARSGTTILLKYFYETGHFATQTYRDMPFVLMPGIWHKPSARTASATHRERAHGDGIMIGPDSPEAFEEVFWRVFCGKKYIKPDRLILHPVDADIAAKFKAHVGRVAGAGKRYLSKNNNNILRLDHLIITFPDAQIIVPFRDPLQHAISLLEQHRRFCAIQQKDKFTLDYMNWLGHFEFGLDQKPFFFGDETDFIRMSACKKTDINFWLLSWKNYYAYALRHFCANMIWVDYDAFCNAPESYLVRLFGKLHIPGSLPEIVPFNPFKKIPKIADSADRDILQECAGIYERLKGLAAEL